MGRKPLIKSAEHYYHVYNRSNHKEWFSIPLYEVWSIAQFALKQANKKHPIVLAQFVLMNNHFHMLIKTPHLNLSEFMYEFSKSFSLDLRRKTKLENRMFGGRYKGCMIRNFTYLNRVYRYIYQNPVRAGMVQKVEDYPYSTAIYQKNNEEFALPTVYPLFHSMKEMLDASNETYDDDQLESIKKGLKKTIFQPVFK